jgi:hypothetical protein
VDKHPIRALLDENCIRDDAELTDRKLDETEGIGFSSRVRGTLNLADRCFDQKMTENYVYCRKRLSLNEVRRILRVENSFS